MNEAELREALDRATAHVEAPHLPQRALAERARRVRRRRAFGAGAVVLALVLPTVFLVRDDASPQTVDRPPTPGPTPTSVDSVDVDLPTAPPIDPSVVQPPWDPDTVGSLPQAALGLPVALNPTDAVSNLTTISAARAAVMIEGRVHLLAVDGSWHATRLPEEWDEDGTYDLALSRDGTIVSVTGTTDLLSLDVRSGWWHRVPYPDGFVVNGDSTGDLQAQGDGQMTWLTGSRGRWEVDVLTGRAVKISVPRHVHEVAFAHDGDAVGVGDITVAFGGRTITRLFASEGPVITETNDLQHLSYLATDGDSLAAVRSLITRTNGDDPRQDDGLIALDLDDMSTRAYLPLVDPRTTYSGGFMEPTAWLDDDTLLVWSIDPGGGFVTGDRTLFTWEVESGELRRVTSLPAAWPYDIALNLLGEQ